MRLMRFKVSDFRSVVDSEWIDAERVTALIGVNESGKTNLLLPLWKLNPAREGEIRPTSDYPKGYFGAVRENPGNYAFILAEFEVPPDLATRLSAMTGVAADKLDVVRVGRDYKNQTLASFPKYVEVREVASAEIVRVMQGAKTEIVALSPLQKETNLHSTFQSTIDSVTDALNTKEQQTAADLAALIVSLKNQIPEVSAPTSTIVPSFRRLVEALESTETKLKTPAPHQVEGVRDLIWKNVPRFVYYSNYGNLDSEIYLPHVVDNLTRDDLGAKEAARARTLRVLFKFVRLEPNEILDLGRDFQEADREPTEEEIAEIATKKRQRTILLNSAGTELTKSFREWWKQEITRLIFRRTATIFAFG